MMVFVVDTTIVVIVLCHQNTSSLLGCLIRSHQNCIKTSGFQGLHFRVCTSVFQGLYYMVLGFVLQGL